VAHWGPWVGIPLGAAAGWFLGPPLAVLLLRPIDEGVRVPLPRLAFVLLGGWLGYAYLAPPAALALQGLAGRLPGDAAATLLAAGPWPAWAAGVLAGAAVGWFLGPAVNWLLGWSFAVFNHAFQAATGGYGRLVGLALRGSAVMLLLYVGLIYLTYWGFLRLPAGYIPNQDKGYLLVTVQLPDSASLERTRAVVNHIDRICLGTPGVAHTISTSGQSFTLQAYGSNFGNFFVNLDDFDRRRSPDLYGEVIANKLRQQIGKEVPDALVNVFGPPPVNGLGNAGGFKFIVEDRGDRGLEALQKETDNLIRKAGDLPNPNVPAAGPDAPPALTNVFTVFRANSPQLYVDVNRDQCARMGVPLNDVFVTLQVFLGSQYVNDFNKFGRTWQVVVQAEGEYRDEVEDVKRLKVRNVQGGMVPLGTVATVREINGPLILTRYNMYPAAAIQGGTAPGVSSGQSIELMQKLADRELPENMAYEWTEITYMQLIAGNTAWVIFVLAVLLVFLVLAALYESWALPLAVILVVPMCILGSITGVAAARSDVNIFTQIGFVVLVGLASKNAILIVEFAKIKREAGMPRLAATLEAVRLRLRPILMTSFAFILGVVPLLVATGAGAEMRKTLGTAVFAGMLGVTFFGIFLTPVFFYVIDWLGAAPVFASRPMRFLGLVLLHTVGILTLGLFWVLLLLFRELRRRERPAIAEDSGPAPRK
jgi:multidrug efflux pump